LFPDLTTDPPYGVAYDATWRRQAGVNQNTKKLGTVTNDDRVDWSPAWTLFPGDAVYVWHAGLHAAEVQASLEVANFKVRSQITRRMPLVDERAHALGGNRRQREPAEYRAEMLPQAQRQCAE
jgi:hypothetical protein